MNTLMIAVIALVAFIYCGGSRVPPVLRQNKDMILGVVGGLVLASFAGLRLEGATMPPLSQAKQDGLKERERESDGETGTSCGDGGEGEEKGYDVTPPANHSGEIGL
jgi:hypothetical protein